MYLNQRSHGLSEFSELPVRFFPIRVKRLMLMYIRKFIFTLINLTIIFPDLIAFSCSNKRDFLYYIVGEKGASSVIVSNLGAINVQ